MAKTLTHLDERGKAQMVDVSAKPETARSAIAQGEIELTREAFLAVKNNLLSKGDALQIARLAGIQAAKKTWELIPLCHQIPLASISVEFMLRPRTNVIEITAEARTSLAQTGVEMEVLTAVSITALTIYDMTKSISHEHTIRHVKLLEKRGGRSGIWRAAPTIRKPLSR